MSELVSEQNNNQKATQQADLSSWRQKIREIQTQKATPEVFERLKKKSEEQVRAQKAYENARFLERCNNIQSASNALTLRSMNVESAFEQTISSEVYAKRSSSLQQTLAKRKGKMSAPISKESNVVSKKNDLEDDEEEIALNEIENELTSMTLPGSVASPPQDATSTTVEVDQLLQILKVEPQNDEELEAKFKLFENFLATVTAIREQLLTFWDENKDQFTGASYTSCQKEIKAIDNEDAMSIPDYGWFVYHMTKKANQNSSIMAQTLARLRARLELLAQELGECPCCLDQLTKETSTTLSCCHKMCNDCWANWQELKGSGVFCPLCKHQEFVEEVIGSFGN